MSSMIRDLLVGFRVLSRNPVFTLTSLLCLAIGLGASAIAFSLIYGVLLRPLELKDQDELVMLWETQPEQEVFEDRVTAGNFEEWRQSARSFQDLAAWRNWSPVLTDTAEPEELGARKVSANYFSLLGKGIAAGRDFEPDEDRPGYDQVVILSHGLWQRRFGADPKAIGRAVVLDDLPHTIIGVARPERVEDVDLWAPLGIQQDRFYRTRNLLRVTGRLRPDVRLEQAQQEMDTLAAELARRYPDANEGRGVKLVPLHEQLVGSARPVLKTLALAVAFVLLIACVNVANLLLARVPERSRELALRTALGSTPFRLSRQLMTESVLLTLVGGGFGLVLAKLGLDSLVRRDPGILPRLSETQVDGWALLFTLAICLLTGVVFGLVPSFHAASLNVNESLKEGGRSGSTGVLRARLRSVLVVLAIASSVVLLIAAGLLIRSFFKLNAVDPGFKTDRLLVTSLSLNQNRFSESHQLSSVVRQLVERVRTLPGVESAGAATALPLSGGLNFDLPFTIEGVTDESSTEAPQADFRVVSAGYFETLGIPLREGRYFNDFDDRQEAPGVVIVNETLARRFWKDESPIGRQLTFHLLGERYPREVIGVVGDVRYYGLDSAPRMELFVTQRPLPLNFVSLVVRTTSPDPLSLSDAVTSEVRALDPDQPIQGFTTMDAVVADSLAFNRFALTLLTLVAAVALVLAFIGIYGVISYSVSQRTNEIGIRMAMGAHRGDVLGLVFKQGLQLSASGIVLGLVLAFSFANVMASLLFGISVRDPLAFLLAPLFVGTITLLSTLPPALRAVRIQPSRALRNE